MNCLCYSSLLFITNAINAWWYYHYMYSFLFSTLTVTSVLHHTMYTPCTKKIDKISIVSVILCGASILYSKPVRYVYNVPIWGTFILCWILYVYGYHTNRFCYHPDVHMGNSYHCLLHVVSSVGHHLIIFL